MRWRYCSWRGGGEGEGRGADNKLQEDLQTLQGKGGGDDRLQEKAETLQGGPG